MTPSRDEHYEDQFLDEAEKYVERRFGLPAAGFGLAVKRRLAEGQQLYGNRHMTRDPAARAREILEEALDAAAYAVLDSQVRLVTDQDDAAAWHLFEIAQHAAAINAHARQLKSATR